MSNTTSESLTKAYRLIEADELAAARAILQPVLADDPDNVDAWWLYAHSVTDTLAAREALDNVLRLDPAYPGAAELSQTLDNRLAENVTLGLPPAERNRPASDFNEEFATVDDDMPDFDDAPPPPPAAPARERRSFPVLLGAAAVVVVILIVIILLALQPPTPTEVALDPTATSEQVVAPTEEATEPIIATLPTEEAETPESTDPVDFVEPVLETQEVPEIVETEALVFELTVAVSDNGVPTREAVEGENTLGAFAVESTETQGLAVTEESTTAVPVEDMSSVEGELTALSTALGEFELAPEAYGSVETDLGETFVVSVCSAAGQEARLTLPPLMDTLAQQQATVGEEYAALAGRLVNCETGTTVLLIAVPRADAAAYASGALEAVEYEQTWLPQ